MNHLTLTDAELKDVAAFWSTYLKGGGEGEQPTPFQYEALNDARFRDAFFFWLAGAPLPDSNKLSDGARTAYESFGDLPTDFDAVQEAIGNAVKNIDGATVEVEDADTGTVLSLAYLIWAILLGDWADAIEVMNELTLLNVEYAKVKHDLGQGLSITHSDPLNAFAGALVLFTRQAALKPELVRKAAMVLFNVQEGSPSYEYIMANHSDFNSVAMVIGGQDGGN